MSSLVITIDILYALLHLRIHRTMKLTHSQHLGMIINSVVYFLMHNTCNNFFTSGPCKSHRKIYLLGLCNASTVHIEVRNSWIFFLVAADINDGKPNRSLYCTAKFPKVCGAPPKGVATNFLEWRDAMTSAKTASLNL